MITHPLSPGSRAQKHYRCISPYGRTCRNAPVALPWRSRSGRVAEAKRNPEKCMSPFAKSGASLALCRAIARAFGPS